MKKLFTILSLIIIASCTKHEALSPSLNKEKGQGMSCIHLAWLHKSYNEKWQFIEQDTSIHAILCNADSVAYYKSVVQNKFYHQACTPIYDSSGLFIWKK